MYASNEVPLGRGEYSTDGGLDHLIGIEKEFPDDDYSSTEMRKPKRSQKTVKCRLVKNDSGGTLTPKNCVKWSTTAGEFNKYIGAVCGDGDPPAGVVDEYVVSTVPDGALFWIVTDGPTDVLGSSDAAISVGAKLTTDASGQVRAMTGTATTAEVLAMVGRAEEATDGTAGAALRTHFKTAFGV